MDCLQLHNIIEKCAVIGTNIFFLGLFYKQYKAHAHNLAALKAIECLELDNNLPKKIQENGGSIPYAAITGKVQAVSVPLHSEHFTSIRGVIREKIITKYKIIWVPFLRIWNTTDYDVKRSIVSVPFGLYNRLSIFKKPVFVEIIDPALAQELILSEVYNDFKTQDPSFGEAVMGFFLRENVISVQEIENILLEDTSLTAVGKLVIENNMIKLMPPDQGLNYYLTPLSYSALTKKIGLLTTIYKGLTIVMCTISFALFAYILRKSFSKIRNRIRIARDERRRQEARRERMSTLNRDLKSDPKCVVCLESPVEVVILECGHACMCLNCGDQVQNYCPVCRRKIERLIPVFMP